MKTPRVLILDTNGNNIDEIEAILTESKVEIFKVNTERDAIDIANRFEFALVLIDVGKNGVEGFKTAKAIRSDKNHERLNILYVTNNDSETFKGKELLATGTVDLIPRPFVPGILKGKVENAISRYLQRKQLGEELEQRRIIEAELIVSKRLEEEAVISKKQFLSTMSHEIRTPLNAIINTINLLISEGPRKDQLEDMDVLKFSAENLLQLINDILDYSKIDSGKIEFEEIEFNIRKLVAGVHQSLQYGMVKNGIDLEFRVDDKVPVFLMGDSVRLAQIFFNLVGNALKFTVQGKVSLSVEICRELDECIELKFQISDTGIGIPEDKQKFIFEAFAQASTSTTREYGGTGLGLAITKMLVEKQGGRIEVKSKPNEGSTFSVYLMFKKSGRNQQEEKPEKPSELLSLEGMNILIVEDNLINQKIVSRLLTKWNAVVDTAENGMAAVQKVKLNQYQLVLMDLHMPEMNGYEATRKIRKMEGAYFKALPILAVTASAFAEDRKKICASGMDGYIIKPFHPAELNAKISNFMMRKMRVE